MMLRNIWYFEHYSFCLKKKTLTVRRLQDNNFVRNVLHHSRDGRHQPKGHHVRKPSANRERGSKDSSFIASCCLFFDGSFFHRFSCISRGSSRGQLEVMQHQRKAFNRREVKWGRNSISLPRGRYCALRSSSISEWVPVMYHGLVSFILQIQIASSFPDAPCISYAWLIYDHPLESSFPWWYSMDG